MCVDVGHFQPNEITVKTTHDNIILHGISKSNYVHFLKMNCNMNFFLKIEGKHEERNDQHGYVTREYNFA